MPLQSAWRLVVAVDESELIEGSFNWLSAVRRQGARHQKFEVSVGYGGAEAREAIHLLIDELGRRVRN